MKTAITLALTAAFALSAAGCGAGAVTAARYSSAQQVIAALDHGGMRCTGGSDNTPVVSGATSESSCNFSASDSPLIDVVRAENCIHGSDQQSCSPNRPAVMITGHVPAVRVPPDHAVSRVAAAVPA